LLSFILCFSYLNCLNLSSRTGFVSQICMPRSTGGELILADPEIECTFHRLQRDHREAQVQLANELNNLIIQTNKGEAMDKGNEILGDFLTPQNGQCFCYSIIHKLKKKPKRNSIFVGFNRLVEEQDLPKLVQTLTNCNTFTTSFWRLLRLFPSIPRLVPHESSDDCKVGGYNIPKGTILLINTWAIHRDLTVWDGLMNCKPKIFEKWKWKTINCSHFEWEEACVPGRVWLN
ncbi:cytochrome P450, partial [Olea europaea subsp. europaea]